MYLEILQQEKRNSFIEEDREHLRVKAKNQILDIQEGNNRNFNKKMKNSTAYKEGELVCIKKTQFGNDTKLKLKYLLLHKITKVKEIIDMMLKKPIRRLKAPIELLQLQTL